MRKHLFVLIAMALPLSPLAAQTADTPVAASTATPARPLGSPATWLGLEDYPAGPYQARVEGSVRVRLSIAPLGFVDGCTVVESSGYEELDTGTCRILSARAFFNPARNAAGQAIAGEYVRRIRWQHPELHPVTATPEAVAPPVTPPQ